MVTKKAVVDVAIENNEIFTTSNTGIVLPAPPPNIYQLISTISAEAGALAPEKTSGVPFAFRGVDAVVSHVAPLLKKYGVIVVPNVIEVKTTYREINPTKGVTQTDLVTEFRFFAPDGTSVSAITAGLAQDYADRSAAQAQSVAFRVALLQTFALPTTDKEPEVVGEETQKFIRENAATAKQAPAAAGGVTVTKLTRHIKELIAGEYVDEAGVVHEAVPVERINELGKEISGKEGNAWRTDIGVLGKVIKRAIA